MNYTEFSNENLYTEIRAYGLFNMWFTSKPSLWWLCDSSQTVIIESFHGKPVKGSLRTSCQTKNHNLLWYKISDNETSNVQKWIKKPQPKTFMEVYQIWTEATSTACQKNNYRLISVKSLRCWGWKIAISSNCVGFLYTFFGSLLSKIIW